MHVLCLDLEGVLIPEIWVGVADRTGIDALRVTTREIPDYRELMAHRLETISQHDLTLSLVQDVIAGLEPLPGAREFLDAARVRYQVAILSDTFYEFAMPFMAQLGYPTLLCHRLEVDVNGRITGYRLRQDDPKRSAVKAFHAMNYQVVASGDSYNDLPMLQEADAGVWFCAPRQITRQHPQFPLVETYDRLLEEIETACRQFRG
ncbi:MAG: bifunctional phosphoserine phosphatase/homoserine phosphotransferase ThrH [Pseudomonadales bacterium]